MHALYVVSGILVLISGLPFLCASVLTGASAVNGFQSGELLNADDGWLILPVMLAVCAAGPVLCLMGGLLIYLANISYEAALTSEIISFGPVGRVKTLRLFQITHVLIDSSWPKGFPLYPWKLVIKDSQGQQIQMPVARWAWLKFSNNIFDYKAMLGDLLQRLPATTVVDEAVKNFSITGYFPGTLFWMK